jgi:hypothetical protein
VSLPHWLCSEITTKWRTACWLAHLGLQTVNCRHQGERNVFPETFGHISRTSLKASQRKTVNIGMAMPRSWSAKAFFQWRLAGKNLQAHISLPQEALLESKRPFSVKFSHTGHHIMEKLFRPSQTGSWTIHNGWQSPDSPARGSGLFALAKADLRTAWNQKPQAKPFGGSSEKESQ